MSKAKNTTRRGARELAFQVLYGLSFTPAESRADLRRAFVLSPHNTAMDEQDLGSEPRASPGNWWKASGATAPHWTRPSAVFPTTGGWTVWAASN